MAVLKRKSGGGRKPVKLHNPFLIYDGEELLENTLWFTEDELDIRIEDILLGCVRSFNADCIGEGATKQEYVHWYKLYNVYRNVNELTRPNVQEFLSCSKAQAERYMRVIKLCNVFFKRQVPQPATKIKGYVHATHRMVRNGYLEII